MANSGDFIAHVLEMMRPAGRATARAMFGGHGLYVDGMIVAIVVDDTLYLKTDEESRSAFVVRGLLPFRYRSRRGDVETTGYYQSPDEVLESPDAMREWLRLALAAALRRADRKPARAPKAPATKPPRGGR